MSKVKGIWIIVIILLVCILVIGGIFALNNSNDTKNPVDVDTNNKNSNSTEEKYGITKTIYYEDKYSVKIKFPDEHYDYSPESKDTASFSGDGLIRFESYFNRDTEIGSLQWDLDVAKRSDEYTTYFEKVQTAKINNMDVYYIYYSDNEHSDFSIRADIYITSDVKYYINYYPDKDEVANEQEAYSKLVEIINSIGKIKEI